MQRFKTLVRVEDSVVEDGQNVFLEDFHVEAPNLEVATQMAALRAIQGWERLCIRSRLPRGAVTLMLKLEPEERRTA